MRKILIPFILLLFVNCASDDSKTDFTEANENEILAYISDEGLVAQKSVSGLYYVINNEGSANTPLASSNVTVAYKGYFTDGEVFDESNDAGISFNLNQVIPGWTEGLTYFGEGGSGVLLIPSRLGYGDSGRGSIPGGAVLIFDVALRSIN
ncbi:MAG: FKBP-type peptidyl-prolyl cis-trans isomerase FkpA [Maribacter sp.]|jgi:FKBP-type peptidyl-prolyl cis-trans isomerase FkpA|tara:strand:- start:140 stop:592 length:453 start_codon:yes stop_codon:yes gene_type:complete